MVQNYTVIQEAVRSLAVEDRVYLMLIDYEDMTDNEIIERTITIYNHIKTMSDVINRGFKFSDAPTPNEYNQSLMKDDFSQKSAALVHLIEKSKDVQQTLAIYIKSGNIPQGDESLKA